jgi:predicted metal-dependent HD superfamily phosphohydrolase
MRYRERFLNLCVKTGISSAVSSEVWSILESRYSESHRHYHNLRHIGSMLEKLDLIDAGNIGLEFAIWFHDVVYDPKARDNEEQSAVLFESMLGGHLDDEIAKEVVRLILATDHARVKTGRHDENLMRDIDLTILASSEDEYREYASAIRREYAHVPDEDFRRGRSAVLEHFLKAPIFGTVSFSRFESAARLNLESERNGLLPGND